VLEGADAVLPALIEAAEAAARDVAPRSDAHGSAAFRRRLVAVEVRRALEHAVARGADTDPIAGDRG
jgi:CO/xanthine dehydrogenase FAD-binding subunit